MGEEKGIQKLKILTGADVDSSFGLQPVALFNPDGTPWEVEIPEFPEIPVALPFEDDFSEDSSELYVPGNPAKPWVVIDGRLRPDQDGGAWQGAYVPVPRLRGWSAEIEYFTGNVGGRASTLSVGHDVSAGNGVRASMQGWDNSLNIYEQFNGADTVRNAAAGGEAVPVNSIRRLVVQFQPYWTVAMQAAYFANNPHGAAPAIDPVKEANANNFGNPAKWHYASGRISVSLEDPSAGIESIRILPS